MQKDTEVWFNNVHEQGKWTANIVAIAHAYFRDGFEPRCITRDLSWGIPVPVVDGVKDKTTEEKIPGKSIYGWLEAPIAYMSITSDYYGGLKDKDQHWKKWWQLSKSKVSIETKDLKVPEVEIHQFIGKDNAFFHFGMFPATQIGAHATDGEEFRKVHTISCTEFIQYGEGKKFSKSLGTGVFCDTIQTVGIHADVIRWCSAIDRPETTDSVFDWNNFQAKNNELVNNIGNVVMRSLKFILKRHATSTSSRDEINSYIDSNTPELEFVANIVKSVRKYTDLLDSTKIKEACKEVLKFSQSINAYWQECALWKKDVNLTATKMDTVINSILNAIYILAHLLHPFMPTVCIAILLQLDLPFNKVLFDGSDFKPEFRPFLIPIHHQVKSAEQLFNVLDNDFIASMMSKFG